MQFVCSLYAARYIRHAQQREMKEHTVEERRAMWRLQYHNRYPEGFKRQRNAEQTARQRKAQRKYDQKRSALPMRIYQRKVQRFLSGIIKKKGEELVGCTREQLVAHLTAPLDDDVIEWKLQYLVHPREFDLNDAVQRSHCFHYTNLAARPVKRRQTTAQHFVTQTGTCTILKV